MKDDDLPPAVARIARRLPTIDHLEVLLLLERDAGRWWTPHDVADILFGDTRLVLQLLRDLAGREFLAASPEADGRLAFRFDPRSAPLRDAVAGLRVAYDQRPFAVIRAVHQVSSRSARSLADAFRFRRSRDEE